MPSNFNEMKANQIHDVLLLLCVSSLSTIGKVRGGKAKTPKYEAKHVIPYLIHALFIGINNLYGKSYQRLFQIPFSFHSVWNLSESTLFGCAFFRMVFLFSFAFIATIGGAAKRKTKTKTILSFGFLFSIPDSVLLLLGQSSSRKTKRCMYILSGWF